MVGEPLVAVPALKSIVGLENAFGVHFLGEDEAAGQRIIGDAFETDVADRGAELDGLRRAAGQRAAGDDR